MSIYINKISHDKFINYVLFMSTIGVTLTMTTAYLLSLYAQEFIINNYGLICIISSLLLIGNIGYISITHLTTIHRNIEFSERDFCYLIACISTGFFFSIPMMVFNFIDNTIVETTLLTTFGLVTSLIIVALLFPKNDISSWRTPLCISVLGLIIIQLMSFGSYYIFNDHVLANILYKIDTYIGIIVFSFYMIYDIKKAEKMFYIGDLDYLYCAISIYLDIINIFIRLIEIVHQLKKKKK